MKKLLVLLVSILIFASCEKDENLSKQFNVDGVWQVENVMTTIEVFGYDGESVFREYPTPFYKGEFILDLSSNMDAAVKNCGRYLIGIITVDDDKIIMQCDMPVYKEYFQNLTILSCEDGKMVTVSTATASNVSKIVTFTRYQRLK